MFVCVCVCYNLHYTEKFLFYACVHLLWLSFGEHNFLYPKFSFRLLFCGKEYIGMTVSMSVCSFELGDL